METSCIYIIYGKCVLPVGVVAISNVLLVVQLFSMSHKTIHSLTDETSYLVITLIFQVKLALSNFNIFSLSHMMSLHNAHNFCFRNLIPMPNQT